MSDAGLSEDGQKSELLVWLLNLPVIGLGNFYATGPVGWRWLLMGALLQWWLHTSHAGFTPWLITFVIFSLIGKGTVAEGNKRALRSQRSLSGNTFKGDSSPYASARFEEKAKAARQALATGSKTTSEQKAVKARSDAQPGSVPARGREQPRIGRTESAASGVQVKVAEASSRKEKASADKREAYVARQGGRGVNLPNDTPALFEIPEGSVTGGDGGAARAEDYVPGYVSGKLGEIEYSYFSAEDYRAADPKALPGLEHLAHPLEMTMPQGMPMFCPGCARPLDPSTLSCPDCALRSGSQA